MMETTIEETMMEATIEDTMVEARIEEADQESVTPLVFVDTFGPVGRTLELVARAMAWVGGLIFIALVFMSVVSIVGRKLWGLPIPGDLELLQMCAAVASAAFFPYCHLHHGDVKIDFFTHTLPQRTIWAIDAVGSLLVGFFAAILAWCSGADAVSVKEIGERSMLLNWPVWIPRALMTTGFVFLTVCGFYMFVHQLRMARRGQP